MKQFSLFQKSLIFFLCCLLVPSTSKGMKKKKSIIPQSIQSTIKSYRQLKKTTGGTERVRKALLNDILRLKGSLNYRKRVLQATRERLQAEGYPFIITPEGMVFNKNAFMVIQGLRKTLKQNIERGSSYDRTLNDIIDFYTKGIKKTSQFYKTFEKMALDEMNLFLKQSKSPFRINPQKNAYNAQNLDFLKTNFKNAIKTYAGKLPINPKSPTKQELEIMETNQDNIEDAFLAILKSNNTILAIRETITNGAPTKENIQGIGYRYFFYAAYRQFHSKTFGEIIKGLGFDKFMLKEKLPARLQEKLPSKMKYCTFGAPTDPTIEKQTLLSKIKSAKRVSSGNKILRQFNKTSQRKSNFEIWKKKLLERISSLEKLPGHENILNQVFSRINKKLPAINKTLSPEQQLQIVPEENTIKTQQEIKIEKEIEKIIGITTFIENNKSKPLEELKTELQKQISDVWSGITEKETALNEINEELKKWNISLSIDTQGKVKKEKTQEEIEEENSWQLLLQMREKKEPNFNQEIEFAKRVLDNAQERTENFKKKKNKKGMEKLFGDLEGFFKKLETKIQKIPPKTNPLSAGFKVATHPTLQAIQNLDDSLKTLEQKMTGEDRTTNIDTNLKTIKSTIQKIVSPHVKEYLSERKKYLSRVEQEINELKKDPKNVGLITEKRKKQQEGKKEIEDNPLFKKFLEEDQTTLNDIIQGYDNLDTKIEENLNYLKERKNVLQTEIEKQLKEIENNPADKEPDLTNQQKTLVTIKTKIEELKNFQKEGETFAADFEKRRIKQEIKNLTIQLKNQNTKFDEDLNSLDQTEKLEDITKQKENLETLVGKIVETASKAKELQRKLDPKREEFKKDAFNKALNNKITKKIQSVTQKIQKQNAAVTKITADIGDSSKGFTLKFDELKKKHDEKKFEQTDLTELETLKQEIEKLKEQLNDITNENEKLKQEKLITDLLGLIEELETNAKTSLQTKPKTLVGSIGEIEDSLQGFIDAFDALSKGLEETGQAINK